MRKLPLLLTAVIVLVLGLTGSGAFASSQEICHGSLSGAHGSVTVVGMCTVSGPVTIHGDLTLTDGSVFGGFGPPVEISGNVLVGKGAEFALGYNRPPGVIGPDTVGGSILANQPLSIYLGNSTVHGSLVSIGGGTPHRFFNFPIKDNRIDGNVLIHGWTGGWWGLIANSIGGSVVLSNNRSVVVPADEDACEGTFPAGCAAAPGVDPDSSEVQSRIIPGEANNPQTIGGNLICFNNSPPAHYNPDDGGAPNIVGGLKLGECTAA